MYDKKLQEFNDRQQLLLIEKEEHTQADTDYLTTVAAVFSLAQKARTIFDDSETPERQAIVGFLVQNATLNGRKLKLELKRPFDTLVRMGKCPSWLGRWGSNPQPCG